MPPELAGGDGAQAVEKDLLMRIGKFQHHGFPLVEIMIVVAISTLLASMGIASLVQARKKTQRVKNAQRVACIRNLKEIERAKIEWVLTMRKTDDDVPADTDLFGPGKTIRHKPECPASGSYDLKAVREKPTCTVPDHAL